MGIMSRFSRAARQDEAASMIETFYEVSKRNGSFKGEPAETARLIVAMACAKSPEINMRRYHPFILPTACLTVLLMETEEPPEIREYVAGALLAMTKAARAFPKPYSMVELKYLEFGDRVYAAYRAENPEEVESYVPDTPEGRVRAMTDLLNRMTA